jgi:hypothetical protein
MSGTIKKITLIYLGKNGGGIVDFVNLYNIFSDTKKYEIKYYLRSRVEAKINNADIPFDINNSFKNKGEKKLKIFELLKDRERFTERLIVMQNIYSFILQIILLLGGIKCDVVVHNKPSYATSKKILHSLIDRIVINLTPLISKKIYTISRDMYDYYRNSKYSGKTFFVENYHYIKIDESEICEQNEIKKYDFMIFGRNLPYKNSLETYNTFIKLEENGFNFRALIIGDGYDFISTEKIIIENRWISDTEIEKLMLNTKYLVLNYSEVSQAGPALLAQYYGTRIIAPAHNFFIDLNNAFNCVDIVDDTFYIFMEKILIAQYKKTIIEKQVNRNLFLDKAFYW